MFFYIVDDDDATRLMLSQIIEDEDLGIVFGQSNNVSELNKELLALKKVDILLIDLLMPIKDDIDIVRDILSFFKGKIIMISKTTSKELISKAYSNGITYYIAKPINKIEVKSVIKNLTEGILLQKSLHNILSLTESSVPNNPKTKSNLAQDHTPHVQSLLSELGIIGKSGYNDLLNIIDYAFTKEGRENFKNGNIYLKDIHLKVAEHQNKVTRSPDELNRELKASEQRIRRVIYQSLTHFASLGLNDFMNPIFEEHSSNFFDFEIVQKRMYEIKNKISLSSSQTRIDTKKFIFVLYFETQRSMKNL